MKAFVFGLVFICFPCIFTFGQTPTVGVLDYQTRAFEGYTLLFPQRSDSTFLIDNCGRQVHLWVADWEPGNVAYLLENGNLLRTASEGRTANPSFNSGGAGDRLQLLDWDGNLLWDWKYSNSAHRLHHDVAYMPNGNILAMAWEVRGFNESIDAGRDPNGTGAVGIWPETLIEVRPIFPDSAEVVWKWDLWDHLVQDFDSTKDNWGVVADHPELADLNYWGANVPNDPDWFHFNAIDYHAGLDQIMITARSNSEFWILDHSTTTVEAAGHTGGSRGKGGDILYRWGNPDAYRAGTPADRQLFVPHDAHWIADSLTDGGKIMVFNNGTGRPGGNFSSAEIVVPAADSAGNYAVVPGAAFGPAGFDWHYEAAVPTDFYSEFISNAQRLPNGNTLVLEGVKGRILEVNPNGQVVWEYVNPVQESGVITQGDLPEPASGDALENRLFRAYRYDTNYAAFAGRTLVPGDVLQIDPSPAPCIQMSAATDQMLPHFSIFPNPVSDVVFIRSQMKKPVALEVWDVFGRMNMMMMMRNGEAELDVQDWAAGIYFLKVNGISAGKIVVGN